LTYLSFDVFAEVYYASDEELAALDVFAEVMRANDKKLASCAEDQKGLNDKIRDFSLDFRETIETINP
jgi:hypothetical protein